MGGFFAGARAAALVVSFAVTGAATIAATTAAWADPVADFYRNKQIQIYVGYGAGGGFDAYARLISRHLGHHIPGQPTVVVQNMPGAGSLRAANFIYNKAPQDGTAIANFGRNMPLLGLLGGNPAVQFDARKFTWLGSPSSMKNDAYILWSRKDAKAKSLAEILKPDGPPLLLGGTADGSSETDIATLMHLTAGLNVKVIAGYPDGNAINLALARGELEGRFMGLSPVTSTKPDWLKPDSDMQPLMQFARPTRHPRFANVPTAREIARDEHGRALIEIVELPYMILHPYVAPPNVPPDRAKALQTGFAEMCKDPEFLADAAKIHLEIAPVGPDEALEMINRIADAPASIKDEIRKLQSGGG